MFTLVGVAELIELIASMREESRELNYNLDHLNRDDAQSLYPTVVRHIRSRIPVGGVRERPDESESRAAHPITDG